MDNQDRELLNEINERLIRIEKNQIQGRKIRLIILGVVIAAIIIAAVIIVPKVQAKLDELNVITENAQSLVEVLDDDSINGIKEKIDLLAEIDSEKVEDMINTFNMIDFEKLEKSISDIQQSINAIEGLFGR